MPTVSVVIPTYNRADVLPRSIDSVYNQTLDDCEIIIVDDNSSDNTGEIIEQYDDSRMSYIVHEENMGGAAARNTGIEAASSEYIAFLDSDDEWLPTKLEKQLEVFDRVNPHTGVVYTGHYLSDSDSKRLGPVPTASGDVYRDQLKSDYINPTSTVMVRKECFETAGGFNPNLPARQDYDMWLRISEHYEFQPVREPLVVIYEDRDDRISSQYQSRMGANHVMVDRIKDHIRDFGEIDQRRILAKQFESIATFSYISNEFDDSRRYALKSIALWPVGIQRWLLLPLSSFHISPNNRYLLGLKNAVSNVLMKFERLRS
ncbi:glycosyltransferase family 2 protein [Halosolutus gelatinilyticus]|uniref:glycosyltransferase family 2 protein n=1 Tax=Halosolutus gelatinilyticus TaxID=2931975 RepID=UPI001FF43B12|nr:glycosyltransferase family 2 protein [Halosolutus gelatinilyticus]